MASNPYDQFDANPYDQFDAPSQPAAVSAGQAIMDVPRQIGLTGRYALEGNAQVADVLTEPLRRLVINPIINAFGGTPLMSTTQAVSSLADRAGFPQPQGANERVIGDASKLLAGVGGSIKLAGALAPAAESTAGKIVGSFTNAADAQAASAVGAGLAGGAVREAGGGPWAQFGASLAGGVLTPWGASFVQNTGKSAANATRSIFAPKDIEAVLKVDLNRAGVDWNALSREAQLKLAEDARKAVYSGEPLNADALRRLADFRNVGATPTMGAVTQNPGLVTAERNLAKQQANTTSPLGPNLSQIENTNAQRVISTLEGSADSPLDAYATGQTIIDRVAAQDAAANTTKRALYGEAEATAGRQIPLDSQGFVAEAFANLQKSNRAPWLPAPVRTVLNTLSAGKGQFTVDTIDQLKTLLAQETRKAQRAGDGATVAALSDVRNALENVGLAPNVAQTGSAVPITAATAERLSQRTGQAQGLSAEALAAFDRARAFARSQFEWQKSAPFIEDALSGATPDKFVDTHILRASVEDLAKVQRFVANDPTLREAIRKQLIEYIMQRGRVDSDIVKFSSAGMFDAFKALGPRKLAMFFDPKEIGQIRSAINVGRYSQSQPIGSAVNNSNTAAMIWGRLSDILAKGSALPVIGPMVAGPARSLTIGMQGRAYANVPNALVTQAPRQPIPLNALLLSAAAPGSDQ